jgi:hypothetical protein
MVSNDVCSYLVELMDSQSTKYVVDEFWLDHITLQSISLEKMK